MRSAVRAAFVPLTANFEGGYITWMFPDVKGFVSTGFGLLLDPVALAITLPWRRPDGTLAGREEIVADWLAVKNYPDAPRLGYRSVEHVAKLRLDHDGLTQAVGSKLDLDERTLKLGFPDFDAWPADAQLGALSMAWACGPAFWDPHAGHNYWPKLTAALRARDFETASVECFMPEEKTIGGLHPRNVANRLLFQNASRATLPDVLYWPRDLQAEVPDDTPTVPAFDIVHPAVPLGDADTEPPDAA